MRNIKNAHAAQICTHTFLKIVSSLRKQNIKRYNLVTSHPWKLLKLLMTTQNPQISGYSSLVSLFQSSSSSRTSSSIALPPSLAISALISPSSFSSVCLVYFKDPNFSSSVTQYFFNSTSSVRCRRIPDWWQLRLIHIFHLCHNIPTSFTVISNWVAINRHQFVPKFVFTIIWEAISFLLIHNTWSIIAGTK